MFYRIFISAVVAMLFMYWLFCMFVVAIVLKYQVDWKAIKEDNKLYCYIFRISYIIGNITIWGFTASFIVMAAYAILFER